MTINELCIRAHKYALKQGFWIAREYNQSHIFQIAKAALIGEEVGELLSGIRHNDPENVGEELADIVIRVADFCQAYEYNLKKEIEKKMKYNETRPQMHGKNA